MEATAQNSKLHHRYAFALCDLAKETKNTDSLLKEVEMIIKMYEENPNFDKLFKSPLISSKKQIDIVQNIFSFSSDKKIKVSKVMYSFLVLLCKNSRLNNLKGVLFTFKSMVSSNNREIDVTVTSAIELSTDIRNDLISLLENKMKKKVRLKNIIDKKIIGGLILQIGSDLIDASIKNKVFKINNMIKGAI